MCLLTLQQIQVPHFVGNGTVRLYNCGNIELWAVGVYSCGNRELWAVGVYNCGNIEP